LRSKLKSLIDELVSFYATFKGRMLFSPERFTQYKQFAQQRAYEVEDYLELIDPNSSLEPEHQCVGYMRASVNAIASFDDGANWLVKIGESDKYRWYVRQEAFLILGMLPPGLDLSNVNWKRVLNVLAQRDAEGEIRKAAIQAIAANNRTELLPEIQDIYRSANVEDGNWVEGNWHDGKRDILMAMTALGDTSQLIEVIEYSFDGWRHKREEAQTALERLGNLLGGAHEIARVLVAAQGRDFSSDQTIWNNLKDHPNAVVKRWALAQFSAESQEESVEECIRELNNDDWGIRKQASINLIDAKPKERLNVVFRDPSQPRLVRSWAAFCLLKIGVGIDELFPSETRCDNTELWQRPFDFAIEDDLRNAIVLEYGYSSEQGTDVRYDLENAMVASDDRYKEAESDRAIFISKLRENGIDVVRATECGEYHHSGGGTYWVLQLAEVENTNLLNVSTLGKYYSCLNVEAYNTVTQVAKELGFAEIKGELAKQIVPQLHVYYFGSRDPLSVYELVFYWQD